MDNTRTNTTITSAYSRNTDTFANDISLADRFPLYGYLFKLKKQPSRLGIAWTKR